MHERNERLEVEKRRAEEIANIALSAVTGGGRGVAGDAPVNLQLSECDICMDEEKTHALLPCGHKCVGEKCAQRFGKESRYPGHERQHHCPVCRASVNRVARVYG